MHISVLSIADVQEENKIKISFVVRREEKTYRKTLKISVSSYDALGCPCEGQSISELDYKRLLRGARAGSASNDALKILSYGDNNVQTLKRKLVSRGHDAKSADEAIEKMTELGYIDEYDQAYRYILNLANKKHFGKRKIYPYLISRGYKKSDIEKALCDAVECGDVDFEEIKRDLICRFSPESEDEVKKLLFKHGFAFSGEEFC